MVKEIDFSVNMDAILADYRFAEENMRWTDTYPTLQSGVQVCSGFPEDELKSCGSAKHLDVAESDFSAVHSKYAHRYIERLLRELPFKVLRMRWLKLEAKSCYSFHYDSSPRLHIPVVTNSEAYFLFKEPAQLVHLGYGKAFVVDTTKTHTALNTSNEPRVHLVGCLTEEPSVGSLK